MKVYRVPYGTQGALVTFFFNAISQFFLKNRLNIFASSLMVLMITGLLRFCTSLLYSLSLYLVFCPWLSLIENQREALLNSETTE